LQTNEMHMRLWVTAIALSFAFVTACASGDPPQAPGEGDGDTLVDQDTDVGGSDIGQVDANQPDASQPDASQPDASEDTGPTFAPPQFYHSTSGGGLSTSTDFKLQMNFGAPMPRGTSSNAEYRIRFGPVSP
jgi:hypothetical protein